MKTAQKTATGFLPVLVSALSHEPFVRAFLLSGVAAVVLLTLSGCGEPQSQVQNAPGEPMAIEPGKSVGPITAGMTVKEVVAKLGEPQFRTGNALEYKNQGFAVMPDADGVVQVVMCGDVVGLNGPLVKNFTGRTKEGIGMLSTREDVVKAYGNPTRAESHPGGRESLEYGELGITFSMESGKVHHMIVRLGEQFHPPPAAIEVTK